MPRPWRPPAGSRSRCAAPFGDCLKKRLGLNVISEKVEEKGRLYQLDA